MLFKSFLSALTVLSLSLSVHAKPLTGQVMVDGSSTVFPITEAVAEEFQRANRKVRVTVGVSGTGGGFKKFLIGETDINDASRRIKPGEVERAKKNGIEYIELPVAFDGISVLVNKKNDFVTSLTMAELKKLWAPGSKVKQWSDIRPEWPAMNIKLYGPGTDSGTFDYFTEAVNGKSRVSRSKYTKSEDDNVLVKGIAGGKHALGYLGFAYYIENKNRIKAVHIDGGAGPIAPNQATINSGAYPLSRPVYIYVSKKSAQRPEIQAFVKFYLENARFLVKEVGYVPLPRAMYEAALKDFLGFSGKS